MKEIEKRYSDDIVLVFDVDKKSTEIPKDVRIKVKTYGYFGWNSVLEHSYVNTPGIFGKKRIVLKISLFSIIISN